MIKLTDIHGEPVWFNPDMIRAVCTATGKAAIYVDQIEPFWVKDAPEEVFRKIMDYRLEMVRYKAAVEKNEFMIAADHRERLDDLAGLEAEPDAETP